MKAKDLRGKKKDELLKQLEEQKQVIFILSQMLYTDDRTVEAGSFGHRTIGVSQLVDSTTSPTPFCQNMTYDWIIILKLMFKTSSH